MRRRYIVRRFQYRLILFQALYFATLCAVIYVCGVRPLLEIVGQQGLQASAKADSAKALLFFDRNMLPALVPTVLVLFVHTVLVSHRIAGPIYRFSVLMRALAQGDLSLRVRIRPRDYLQEEAREFDQAIAGLRERVTTVRGKADALRRELEALGARVPAGGSLQGALAAQAELEKALGGFTLEAPATGGRGATAREAA
jgi:methyl-accepting chemotaxis protein